MNLGEAVYKLIAGKSSRREESPQVMLARALAEAGGVSQLARSLGVARTTVQRWNKGVAPTQESQELLRAVLRRADLRDAREARLRTSDRLIVKGKQDGRPRTVNLSPHLRPGTMGRAVEAYLRGARPIDLHAVVWAGITDRAYSWMFQPPGGLAQMAPEDRRAAAHPGGGAGGSGGGGGHSGGGGGPSGSRGGDDEDEDDFDLDGDDEDDYDGGDYLDDLYGEGLDVDDNDGYEFSVGSASA